MEQIINPGASTSNIETQLREYNKNIEDLKNKVQELENNKTDFNESIIKLKEQIIDSGINIKNIETQVNKSTKKIGDLEDELIEQKIKIMIPPSDHIEERRFDIIDRRIDNINSRMNIMNESIEGINKELKKTRVR